MRAVNLLAAILLLTTVAGADDRVERRPLDRDGEVRVSLDRGDVAILGWDRPVCEVSGDGRDQLELTGTRKQIVVAPEGGRQGRRADVEIRVPHGARVLVVTVSADVWIEGLTGDVTVETVSGDLEVRGRLRRLAASRMTGDLTLDAAIEVAELTTVDGDISVANVRRELRCFTLDGDLSVQLEAELARLDLESLAGDAEVTGAISPDAVWRLNLQEGDAAIRLAGPVDATFDLQSLLGGVACPYPRIQETPGDRGAPGRERFKAGDGRASVTVDVLRGDIAVRR